MTPEILTQLVSTSLDDIHVAGFIDEDESPARFHGQFRLMYLDLGGQLLELRCIEDTGRMNLSLASAFSDVPDLDEDMRPCVMSVRELVLADPDSDNAVVKLTLIGASFDQDSAACSAAQVQLANGQVVFIDPSYHFGIRIGGIEQRSVWRENWPQAASMQEWSSEGDE